MSTRQHNSNLTLERYFQFFAGTSGRRRILAGIMSALILCAALSEASAQDGDEDDDDEIVLDDVEDLLDEDDKSEVRPDESDESDDPDVIEFGAEDLMGEEGLEDFLNVEVVTASRQKESLDEAPVPVTVITSSMIRQSGAKNLQELLYTYVPGMTYVVDHNEMNVAMRGVYASSQQKILILLNGHRLNSRAYSMANPDHSIGIDPDKIKQIEILRGPGSSLYGNVALTAVINIVLRKGADLNGASVTLGGGDFVSRGDGNPLMSENPVTSDDSLLAAGRTLRFTYGTSSKEQDLLLWGSFFHSDGQVVPIERNDDLSNMPTGGYAILDGNKDPISYDLGLSYSISNLSVLANIRQGKVIEPFSAGGDTGEAYSYDDYRTFGNAGPGLGSRSHHIEVNYDTQISDKFSFDVTGYHDSNDITVLLIIDPASQTYGNVSWNDHAFGSVVQGRYEYDAKNAGKGNVTAGVQLDYMRLLDSNFVLGTGGDWTGVNDTGSYVLDPGSEIIYSGFLQFKHRLSQSWLFNVGGRTDVKDRHQGSNKANFSPRLAAIWTPNEQMNTKLSYSESFVDAPYWYRYNSLASYQGASTLTPERLRSLQLTQTFRFMGGRLQLVTNAFLNNVFDFVYRIPEPGPDDPFYENAGELTNVGIESELALLYDRLQLRGNITYAGVVDSEDYNAQGSRVENVPSLVANLILTGKPVASYSNLETMLTARFVGNQLAPINTWRMNGDGMAELFQVPNNEEDAYMLLNTGVRLSDLLINGLDFDATLFNVFDTRYEQGGSVRYPYPQPGRSFFVTLSYQFQPSNSTRRQVKPVAQ
ncbi:MAG: TonB-dependent receptor [Proteobacteria bacterium]|nr:TonB-dependent receptor [Pseudomonadota bacterium]